MYQYYYNPYPYSPYYTQPCPSCGYCASCGRGLRQAQITWNYGQNTTTADLADYFKQQLDSLAPAQGQEPLKAK